MARVEKLINTLWFINTHRCVRACVYVYNSSMCVYVHVHTCITCARTSINISIYPYVRIISHVFMHMCVQMYVCDQIGGYRLGKFIIFHH